MPAVRESARMIGEQLVKKGILTAAQLKEVADKQRLSG